MYGTDMANTTQVLELSRIRQIGNLWVVEILSAAIGKWIIQGVHPTKVAAEADRRNWL